MRPTIALPTGPFDWHPNEVAREMFEARLAAFRQHVMADAVTHCVVHGNGFDHEALSWLSHFTPKLGPAYLLVPREGTLRLLFSGGPGMKPSAARLTWVEDVSALGAIEKGVSAWIEQTSPSRHTAIGLIEGEGMLLGDWRAVRRASGGELVPLDDLLKALCSKEQGTAGAESRARALTNLARGEIAGRAKQGADLRTAIIETERALYNAGAQDVRVLASLSPGGRPTTWADQAGSIAGSTTFEIHIRAHGEWACVTVHTH